MSEWRQCCLADVTESLDSLRKPVKGSDRKLGQYPYYGASGIVDYVDNYLFDGLHLLVAEDGENLKTRKTPIAFLANGKFWVNNHAHVLRENEKSNIRFLSYALQVADIHSFLTGSTIPKLTKSNLDKIPIYLPNKKEQSAIAEVLGALDDKIELNRRMNATLEVMARALFKSWFVDFDPVRAKMEGKQPFGMPPKTAALFPSHLVPSELGDIPEGWLPSNLVAEFDITMGQSPPGETYNECGEGLPFYQGRTDFGSRYPSRRIFCTQPNRLAEVGDTLISVRAPVGDINMASEKCILGRGVAALRHKSKARGYTYYALHSVQPDLKAFEADGTVFGSVNKQDLGKIKFIHANDALIKQFEAVIGDIDEKILALTIENKRLEKSRDYLLPKLISGDIRIPDAEKFVEAA